MQRPRIVGQTGLVAGVASKEIVTRAAGVEMRGNRQVMAGQSWLALGITGGIREAADVGVLGLKAAITL